MINFFSGRVHISKDKSLHGTYTGVEPIGLLWSMLPYAQTKVLEFVERRALTLFLGGHGWS